MLDSFAQEWNAIRDHYARAAACLWGPEKPVEIWRRDEDNGYYHLWSAYHMALRAPQPADHLVYARILAMMADEKRCGAYEKFHKYLMPASEQYKLALESGQTPTAKELEKNARLLEYHARMEINLSDSEEAFQQALEIIEGSEALEDFEFCDSRVLRFEHDLNRAEMVLDYDGDGSTVVLGFWDVYSIESCLDPAADFIGEFHCYPESERGDRIWFDIGIYKILCKRVSAAKISRGN